MTIFASRYSPFIQMSPEDWTDFTMSGHLCDEDGGIAQPQFEIAMRLELSGYSQRLLSTMMAHSIKNNKEYSPILLVAKMMSMEVRLFLS